MRRTQAMAALVGLVGALVLLVAPPASAQTGYPPGLCTTTSGVQFVGNVSIGQRFVIQLAPTCLFTANTPVTVTVNGVNIPGKTAEAGGFVLVDVTVISATELSIDDPVLTPAFCGTNTVVARGASATAQGGTSTQTATFTLTCPSVPVTVTTAPASGLLSRTGASSVRFAAVALALVAAGSLAVVATRRRRAV